MSVAPPHESILQGYLHKRSNHLKLWKVRYFILTKLDVQSDLSYSKKSGKKPKPLCTQIEQTVIVDDQNAVVHLGNHVMELRFQTKKVYLSASTELERETWVASIRSLQRDKINTESTIPAAPPSSFLHRLESESLVRSIIHLHSTHDNKLDPGVRRRRMTKERQDERKRRQLPRQKKTFHELWLQDILNRHDTTDAQWIEALCVAGIPKELRGRVWSWILGNKLQVNEELFNICKLRAHAVRSEMVLKKEAENASRCGSRSASAQNLVTETNLSCDFLENVEGANAAKVSDELQRTTILLEDAVSVAEQLVAQGERSIRLVNLDMPRTFGHHPLFHTGADGTLRTTEVLEAYICYRPDLGYVQGMSYLAATLCFHMDSFTAFKALVALLSNSVLFDMFRMEEKRTFHYIHVYEHILRLELPRLHAHFQHHGIDAQMYAVDWALTLFTRSLPLPLALRIWDCFVLLGTPFFFQASMGLLSLYEDQILKLEPEDIVRFLHNLPKNMSATDLFRAIESVSLSCHEIDTILAGGVDRGWTPDSPHSIEVKYPDSYE